MSTETAVEPVGIEKELAEIEKQLEALPTPSQEAQPQAAPVVQPAEKQADQPAKKEEQPKPVVETEPEDKKPERLSNEEWAAARVAASKKLEKAQAEWAEKEKRLSDEINSLKSRNEQQPKEEPKKLHPEQVFVAYHSALSGKIENAEAVVNAAKTIISKMSHEDIRRVIEVAESGAFGSASNEVLQLAKEEAGVAASRWISDRKVRDEQEVKKREFLALRDASFKRVTEKFPELNDANSEFFKAIPSLREEYIGTFSPDGTVLKKGPLFDLLKEPDWPERITPLFSKLFKAQKDQLTAEHVETTKQKEELKRSPESGGHSGSRQSPSEVDEIEKQLEALGTIGPGG